jgi:MOSC domain-containing protein YiiM
MHRPSRSLDSLRPVDHATAEELEGLLGGIRQAPAADGTVELIVRRPAGDEREVLEEASLDPSEGLVGDTWKARGNGSDPDTQLTLMNARVTAAVARDPARWPLAGDQLYVDLDLSTANLPPGTRLAIGAAVVEVTDQLHAGCAKFTQRFGSAAIRFVNSPAGRELRLRGMYARVVKGGIVRRGDPIRKLGPRPDLARASALAGPNA